MAALALFEDIAKRAEGDWLNSYIRFPRTVLMEMCAELQPHL